MLQTVSEPRGGQIEAVPEAHLLAYRFMLRARLLDEKFAALYRAGKIHGGVFLGRGQEALSAALGVNLTKSDVFAPLIRDQAGRLAFGETILDAVRTYMGSSLGPMRGRDGNVHRGNPQAGYLPMISHLGAMVSVVNGVLFARRMKGITGIVGATCLGDGATSTGAFHEALNQAAVEKLPLILVVADNQYAYSTPTSRQFACDTLADRAVGYGIAAHSVDGTDLTTCLKTVGGAVASARAGNGPQLVVAKLLRLCGHGEHDDASYIDPKYKTSALGRDCMKVAEETILQQKWADASQFAVWRSEAIREIEEAVAQVQREPAPDPFAEEWTALSTKHLIEGNI
ncbi:MAG TPA: thiamine pyrophosphate-dependent dehydrogenase E1 component subunit alpha [Candidatus Acidoferrales bacterium]|jgi:TPP-dependent pyruvate/acetoin dehydrogenase alpha subunit|nr:thiamine pyrophosphate-dependent dehydrogenase E1 component subunit alpha [Candidatus Acidoferrales bacterium]